MNHQSSTPMPAKDQRWGWISGWGFPPAVLTQVAESIWPHHQHTVVAPTPRALPTLRALEPDLLVGYSLGALLLLAENSDAMQPTRIAFAPFLAFDAEAGLGGKTPTRSREAVQARFGRSPTTAIKLYLRLAGLSDLESDQFPYAEADLQWGLEALGELRACPQTVSRSHLFLGSEDPLVDASVLGSRFPHLISLPRANHDFRALLPAASSLPPFI